MLVFLTDKNIKSDEFITQCVKEFLTLHDKLDNFSIIREKNKKPYLNPPLAYFNLSHSQDYTIVAVSHSQVGCDIQKHTSCDIKAISQRFFNLKEQKNLNALRFFDLWAAKEAYIKHKEIDFLKGMKTPIKENFITLLNLLNDYSIAISSDDKAILVIIK